MASPTDPYELERLAQNLPIDSSAQPEHELPAYLPLAHNNPHLLAEHFNVEEFLLSRAHTTLPDLRAEMRDYHSTLKEELVQLINDDYEAFISLSTDLKDEGVRLMEIRSPLSDIVGEVMISREGLKAVQDNIQQQLSARARMRGEKALLHLLLKISESVTRLESLLHITPPAEEQGNTMDMNLLSFHLPDGQQGKRASGNVAKHLSRAAAEYAQILYHGAKARSEKCAYIDEVQWRIDRIQSTLASDLDHQFAATLSILTEGRDGPKATEAEKVQSLADVKECLRAYDVLGLWRDAEDVIRREVVRPFVKKTIFSGAFTSPHSPIAPNTPYPSQPNLPQFLQPQPKTPFTAFTYKQLSLNLVSSPSAQLLDDTDDPLAGLYNQILRFIERDLVRVLAIADSISSKPAVVGVLTAPVSNAGEPTGAHIMANVVWSEIGKAIMDELGGVVFAAGQPDEFRQHHEVTKMFIRSLEHLAPSITSVELMRAHPVFKSFEKRWQLPVYFQLRWKEIVSQVEDVASKTRIEIIIGSTEGSFRTSQAAAIWHAIETCWSEEVFIPELGHRFWKLMLQLISRFKTWLHASLAEHAAQSFVSDKISSSASSHSRSSTPVQAYEASTPEVTAAEDRTLTRFSAVINDIHILTSRILASWTEQISMMLPDMDESDEQQQSEDVLRAATDTLTALIPGMTTQIVTILTKRCSEALLPVRSIPTQFRAIATNRAPTEPSPFVPNILRPLKAFFGIGLTHGPGVPLKAQYLDAFSKEIFANACSRYVHHLTTMKKTEESLRRLRKGKKAKPTFSLFGSSTDNGKDEEKEEEFIRSQIILDVEAFGKDAQTLDIELDKFAEYGTLKELAYAVPEE